MKPSRHLGIRPLPTMVGLLWLVVGIWLLCPWRTFESARSFSTLRQVGSETFHGLLATAVGVLILSPFPKPLRSAGLMLAFVGAVLYAVAFGTANWRGLGLPLWSVITVGCLWAVTQGPEE